MELLQQTQLVITLMLCQETQVEVLVMVILVLKQEPTVEIIATMEPIIVATTHIV